MTSYGEELKALRESRGVTKYRLEQLSGVPRMTISRIESGSVTPGIDLYGRLLTSLGARLVIREGEE